MWYYQQPANPKMTQALIAEVAEFYFLLRFLAAVEETSSLNLDLSVPTAAPSICWQKQPDKRRRRQHLEPESKDRSLHFTDAHAKK